MTEIPDLMKSTLITGLSGTGKSTIVSHLCQRGHLAIDLSTAEWSEWRRVRPLGSDEAGPRDEWMWREDRLHDLLSDASLPDIHVAGCAANQHTFHSRFDRIVLLTATPERMIERLEPRWDLRVATDRFERYQVMQSVDRVLPLLRSAADVEIDTTDRGLEEILEAILRTNRPR